MADQSFSDWFRFIDGMRDLGPGEALRYVLDKYLTSDPDEREYLLLALVAELIAMRMRATKATP